MSTQADGDLPTPATLSDLFDTFVLDRTLCRDSVMMETAGAQCLLLAGFFEDQMRSRHQISWYATLGADFFRSAAKHTGGTRKARLLDAVAKRFESWRRRHAQLSRELRDQQYLLTMPSAPPGCG